MNRRDFLGAAAFAGATPWTNLIAASTARADQSSAAKSDLLRNVALRGSYANSARAFETSRRGKVAFIGGSITEMEGWRPIVCEYFRKKFPQTEFEFIAAGISSTCSDVGAFRLETDVLRAGSERPIDFLFVEFAVNDDQDGRFDYRHSLRGMEGIARHLRAAQPLADLATIFFANENLMQQYRDGKVATSILAHTAVAERYDVASINIAKELQERIDAKETTWEEYGGVHPSAKGSKFCAELVAATLDALWKDAANEEIKPHKLPQPIDPASYFNASWRGFEDVETNVGAIDDGGDPQDGGFKLLVPDWSKKKGELRRNFAGQPCLCAERPGAEASFEFDGDAVALYILAGPDAGVFEAQIDDDAPRRFNARHAYSAGLHYPRAIVLADGLERGRHRATIRTTDASEFGAALRILRIGVN